jgi:hypothetical protein
MLTMPRNRPQIARLDSRRRGLRGTASQHVVRADGRGARLRRRDRLLHRNRACGERGMDRRGRLRELIF